MNGRRGDAQRVEKWERVVGRDQRLHSCYILSGRSCRCSSEAFYCREYRRRLQKSLVYQCNFSASVFGLRDKTTQSTQSTVDTSGRTTISMYFRKNHNKNSGT
ncbi:uncharacterized protein LOC110746898 [Prunus avium]|uniref:Uncharacterized protein LOC110746898 n=1 Tax=Prunus avium TaxID=42229 RepID=A0A6P5RD38_PRUAV|nr:uncharacterized protein LOC110746898 [Prunus avium]